MKKIFLTFIFLMCMVGTAQANWKHTFYSAYKNESLDTAVVRVLSQGVSTTDLFEYAYMDSGIGANEVFVSMFCAGVKSPEIVRIAKLFFLRMSIAVEAYRESTLKCKLGTA